MAGFAMQHRYGMIWDGSQLLTFDYKRKNDSNLFTYLSYNKTTNRFDQWKESCWQHQEVEEGRTEQILACPLLLVK